MSQTNIKALKLSDSSPKAMSDTADTPSTRSQAQLEMLEAEMESLRRRMKLLETRLAEIDGQVPSDTSLSAVNETSPSSINTESSVPGTGSLASANVGAANNSPTRRSRRRSTVSTDSDGNELRRRSKAKPRRRSRASKFKRRLLFGYGLLIGGALLAVLVLMIMNLFGTNHITLDGGATGTGATSSGDTGIELEIDNKPDLDELRRAIENAEP